MFTNIICCGAAVLLITASAASTSKRGRVIISPIDLDTHHRKSTV